MLRRFESIRDSGIFDDFCWNADTPDFERINLIYGANGAGKTSLSHAIDSLRGESGGFAKVSVRMSNTDRTNERQSNGALDAEFQRIFVFSDDYVTRSHDFGEDPTAEAILTLGERTVEQEKRIIELNGLIETAKDGVTKADNSVVEADENLKNEYIKIARGIVAALIRAGGRYHANTSYNRKSVETEFKKPHSKWKLLSTEEKEAALVTVNSDERPSVAAKHYSFEIRQGLPEDAAAVLGASPVSVLLDTLKEHEEASSWVERGRHIHKSLDECIFCGGELSEDRKNQIEKHFSDEVEEVQRATDNLILEVTRALDSVRDKLGDGAVAGSLFDDLRNDFKSAHAEAKIQVVELEQWLTRLLELLKKKRSNVLVQLEYKITEAPEINGSKIEEVLNAHNDRVATHATSVQQAAKMVELHLLKESEAEIARLSAKAKQMKIEHNDLYETLQKCEKELKALENIEGDPLPSADVMVRELTRILGRNELSFEVLPDGKHYRVTRHGNPAHGLSTGERTAITLIHFLENVKRADARTGKPIVVIDDPISSLDSNVAMGISTYIWSETVSKNHIEQVFLLTHNFELFRQWDIQIEGLRKSKKLAMIYPAKCYELVAPHQNVKGTKKRVPTFIVWPPNEVTRLKIRSSYHHAFMIAAQAHTELFRDFSMEKKLDAMLLYPNVLRRMLETFLAFKSPDSVGNFTNAMREIGGTLEELGYAGDADALRLHLTRFTHANSHAESPETDIAVNPDEIGVVIAAVFTFMNAVDQQHFEGLCKVTGFEPTGLQL